MKTKITIISLFTIFFSGCMPVSSYFFKNYEVGQEKSVTVGSVMVSEESGRKNDFGKILSGSKYELVYAGIANNVVQISYKEYQKISDEAGGGDLIRPAFAQDLKYDLSTSPIITYREKRIKVLKATGENITFIVLDDQPLANPAAVTKPAPSLPSPAVPAIKPATIIKVQDKFDVALARDSSAAFFGGTLIVKHNSSLSSRSVEFRGATEVKDIDGKRKFTVNVKKGDKSEYTIDVAGIMVYEMTLDVGKDDVLLSFRKKM
ncbi:MAG: hypothetical protein ACM3MI_03865 [Clostridiales bacterium]